MEESDLIDGEYLYQYIVTDVFGRVFYSDTAIMEYNEGDIYVSMDGEDEYSSDDDYTDYVN